MYVIMLICLKVRLQADNARPKPRYRGVFDAAISIYRRHGAGAFWKGLGPSMGRAGVAVASTFGTYDHVKSILLKNQFKDNFKTHTLSSLMAGFVATLVACPFDVVKTRYQSQSMTRPLYKFSHIESHFFIPFTSSLLLSFSF